MSVVVYHAGVRCFIHYLLCLSLCITQQYDVIMYHAGVRCFLHVFVIVHHTVQEYDVIMYHAGVRCFLHVFVIVHHTGVCWRTGEMGMCLSIMTLLAP